MCKLFDNNVSVDTYYRYQLLTTSSTLNTCRYMHNYL